MRKNIIITETTTISKWYASENFSTINKLCIGKYIPKDNWSDEYVILLKWNLSSFFTGLFSFDKIILRLRNLYKPEKLPQNLFLYEAQSSFDTTSATWNNKPSFVNSPIIHHIPAETYEKEFIDIDITNFVRVGLSGMNLTFTMGITGDPTIDNSIIYFDFNDKVGYPELIIDYTPDDDAFALLINNTTSSISSGLINPGEVINANQLSVINTPLPNPNPVIQISFTGIYEIKLSLTAQEDFDGYFYFKLGNLEDNIAHFKTLEHIAFSKLHSEDLSLIISIEKPSTLLALYYSGANLTLNSLITSIKRISLNNIIEYNLDINPFIGQNSELIDYHIFADDSYPNMTIGSLDVRTFIAGDIDITGNLLNSSSSITLQNIKVSGTLTIDIGNGCVSIENCCIDKLVVISCSDSNEGIFIHMDTHIHSISILNSKKISLKVHDEDISTVQIESLNIHPQANSLNDTQVLLYGHFGMCDLSITRSTKLLMSHFKSVNPITIDISDNFNVLSINGVADTLTFLLLSSITLIGNCTLTNSSVKIITPLVRTIIDGHLLGVNIHISEPSSLVLLPGSCIDRITVKTQSTTSSTLFIYPHFDLNIIHAYSPLNITGDTFPSISVLEKYRAMNNSALVELSPPKVALDAVIGAINKLQKFFISEVSSDISLAYLRSLVNKDFTLVSIKFVSLTHNDSLSYDDVKEVIEYTPIKLSLDNIFRHEAKIVFKISNSVQSLIMPFYLKAKYTEITMDYNSEIVYVPNYADSLKYSLAYNLMSEIHLTENFTQADFELNIIKRNIKFNLQNFEMTLRYIRVQDSVVTICNGKLNPPSNITLWQSNPYYDEFKNLMFIYADEFTSETSLLLDGIIVDFDITDLSFLEKGTKQVSLIQGGCCDSLFSINSLKLTNSDIKLNSPLVGTVLKNTGINIFFSFSRNSHILSSSLTSTQKCITVSSAPLSPSTVIEVTDNTLGSDNGSDSLVLELIPYETMESTSLFINGEMIYSNMDTPSLIDKIEQVASALMTDIPKVFLSNSLHKNSWIYIWKNEKKTQKEVLRFNGINWDVLISNLAIYSENGIYNISNQYGTLELLPLLLPSNANLFNLEWSVSPKEIAKITSHGILTAINEGTATVTLIDLITSLQAELKILLSFSDHNIPPTINPDTTDNNLQNLIHLTFQPNALWSNNISGIKVENSQSHLLSPTDYEVDHNSGVITLNNVTFAELERPIYTNILDVGSNLITIYAHGFTAAIVNQTINPRQTIKTTDGISHGHMRFSEIGEFSMGGIIYSGKNTQYFSDPINVVVLEVIPCKGSIDSPINTEISLTLHKTIVRLDTNLISILSEDKFPIEGLTFSIAENNTKVLIHHPNLNSDVTYWVKFLHGSLTLSNGLISEDIIWSFTTA